jgi:hypothetical protein
MAAKDQWRWFNRLEGRNEIRVWDAILVTADWSGWGREESGNGVIPVSPETFFSPVA